MLYLHQYVNLQFGRNIQEKDIWYHNLREVMEGNKEGIECMFCLMDKGRKNGAFFGGYALCDKHLMHEKRMTEIMNETVVRERS